MTPFTDDELAYLKAELPANESVMFQCARKAFRLEALLARLEAGERIIECHVWGYCGKCKVDHEQEWRKACGR